jgi:metal-responsive CopG/Arc/MetJ family transcriptional regulator
VLTDPERVERMSVSLPRELAQRLRVEADRTNRSVSGVVREAVETYLEGKDARGTSSFAGVGASGRHDVSEQAEELIGGAHRTGQ